MDNTLRTKRQKADGFLSIENMRSSQLREFIAERSAYMAQLFGRDHACPPPPAKTSIKRLREIACSYLCIG